MTFLKSKVIFLCRPEILKQEIKVFFVKYNDPIYVKLEKLDIMIRLASQANIAQVHHMKSNYRNLMRIFIFCQYRLSFKTYLIKPWEIN